MAGGVERVLTLKANYFAEHFGYEITIITTEGAGLPPFYPLSSKVKVINLDIGFEELWTYSFVKKVFVYLWKQRRFKKMLSEELKRLSPDITISLLRREINFLTKINDGSRKIGELHVNRSNYRNFEANESNFFKNLFANYWMRSLVSKLRRLDRFVVLTNEDKVAWPELNNICVIPDPLSFIPTHHSSMNKKRVIAVGRYVYQKGFDLLLRAWAIIEKQHLDWELSIFGEGDRAPYRQLMESLSIDGSRCHLHGTTSNIQQEYVNSSLLAFSSRFEGFGMVLIEAMACGLPVVSFACPCGPRDIISDGVDGILVPKDSVDEFSKSLSKLMDNEDLRVSMAQNAIKKASHFQIDRIALQWRNLFEGVD